MHHPAVFLTFVALLALPSPALAIGESVDGFPSYSERVMHELSNRARVDPQLEMGACGASCGEGACYAPQAPLYYKRSLNRSARFHAAHQSQNGYFAHNSSCTLVADIDARFPSTCSGSASCACVGGVNACSGSCTAWNERVQLFGSGAGGEIIASPSDPTSAFYLWLYEYSASPTCSYSQSNGHRWLLLTASGAVGFGSSGYSVGDFSSGGEQHPIASGSHWPRQADTVEAWANWYDEAPPRAARVAIDGTCAPMELALGIPTNGAYRAMLTGLGSGCHRYYFAFEDTSGALVTFPDTGSLGIGPSDSCPDWSAARPALAAGCIPVPEPTRVASVAVALASLGLLARRRELRRCDRATHTTARPACH